MALFPLHLSSSSILSQHPSPSSNALPFIQTTTSTSTAIFCSHRAEIPISHPSTEIENKQNPDRKIASNAIKLKKKKLRPSFYDQTRYRWSIKTASQRTKFPWQKQREDPKEEDDDEEEDDDDDDEEEGGVGVGEKRETALEHPPSILNSTTPLYSTKGENGWVGKPVSFSFQNPTISAPWAHGSNHRKSHLDSVDELLVSGRRKERRKEMEEKKGLEIHLQDKETAVENMLESLIDFEIGGDVNFKEEEDSNSTSNGDDGDFTSLIVKKLKEFDDDAKNSSLNGKSSGFKDNVPNFPDPLDSSGEKQSGICSDSDVKLMGFFGNGDSIGLPWETEKWRKNNTEVAEKTIPEPELRRLRNVALRMKERMTVGAAGITQEAVDKIHEKWKVVEVVKLKFEGPPAVNMKRTHTILEVSVLTDALQSYNLMFLI